MGALLSTGKGGMMEMMVRAYDAFLVRLIDVLGCDELALEDSNIRCPYCLMDLWELYDDDAEDWRVSYVYPRDVVGSLTREELSGDIWMERWSCVRCFMHLVWDEVFLKEPWVSYLGLGDKGHFLYWLSDPVVSEVLGRRPTYLCHGCGESDFIYSRGESGEEGVLVAAQSYLDAVSAFELGDRFCLRCLDDRLDDSSFWSWVRSELCGVPCRQLRGGLVAYGDGVGDGSS